MLLQKLLKAKRIGTHSEEIHGDEVTGKAVIDEAVETIIPKEDIQIELIRSRDKDVLATCDLLFDVGGENEPYDHHKPVREKRTNGIFYSAVGLLWRDLGEVIIRKYAPHFTDEQVKSAVQRVDDQFIIGICAEDNGQKIYQSEYQIKTYYTIIYDFNMLYEDRDEAFKKALEFAKVQLKLEIKKAIEYIDLKTIVAEELKKKDTPQILVLDRYLAWQEPIIELDKDVLYVVYPTKSGTYMVQTVEKVYQSYENRKDLPESWRGLRDKELEDVTGVKGSVFCHAGLFIAGANTLEGAINLAQVAIGNPKQTESINLVFETEGETTCPRCKSKDHRKVSEISYVCNKCDKDWCPQYSPIDMERFLPNCGNCNNYKKCIDNGLIPF